jgi:hypothetical protein
LKLGSLSRPFHQLDAITERVENMRAAKVADGRVGYCGECRALARSDDFV